MADSSSSLSSAPRGIFSRIHAYLRAHRMVRALLIVLLVLILTVLLLHPHGTKRYLILGIDNYGSLNDSGRSDVMLLVQVDFDRTRIAAVTFARDMFIDSASGRETKINTIVRSQDEDALVTAMESNFGFSIDGWFRVNFSSVISLVDAIGGADVALTQAEAHYIDKTAGAYPDSPLSEGVCHLNGAQALTYARCRALDSDIGRGNRQSMLFEALVQSTKHMTIAHVVSLYNEMNHAWRSSLTGTQQALLVLKALYLRGAQVDRISMPLKGYWHYGNSQHGDSGILIDLEANRSYLLDVLGLSAVN